MTWSSTELESIAAADELRISTFRADGSTRPAVPIRVVRAGYAVYIRSFRGPDGAWFGHAARGRVGTISVPRLQREVRFEPAPVDVADRVDQAYRDKYGRYGPTYLTPMLASSARVATLRVAPQTNPLRHEGASS